MEKSERKNYWGIKQHEAILSQGTYAECWRNLVTAYGHKTLKELEALGIRIARIG